MHINYLLYTPILLSGIFLTGFVLLKNPKKTLNQAFFILGASIVIWVLCLLNADTSRVTSRALFWCQLAIIGPSLIPPAFLNFTLHLIDRSLGKLQNLIFLPSLFFILFSMSSLNVQQVTIKPWGTEVIAGPMYTILFIYFLTYFGIASSFLINKYKLSSSTMRNQLRYVFLGYAIAIIVGLVTNLVLIMLGSSQYSVLGPFSTLIFISTIAYAIQKHHLMDLELIIKRSFIYSTLIAIIAGIYSINAYILGLFLGGEESTFFAVLIQAVLLAVGFKPLESYISHLTDRFLFKGKYDYRQTLQEVTQQMTSIMKLDQLLEIISNTIIREMHASNVCIFLKQNQQYQLKNHQNKSPNQQIDVQYIPEHHPLTTYCNTNKKIFNKTDILDNLELAFPEDSLHTSMIQITEVLQKLHAELFIPFLVKGELIGFMSVGHNSSGDHYAKGDIQLLETLANQSAIAIENASLYSSSLQKVTELLALYEVGQVVTSGQKLEVALQSILDVIINVVKVDRGIIFLYDKSSQQLNAKAARGRQKDLEKIKLEEITLPIKESVFGKMIDTKQALIKPNIANSQSPLGQHFLKALEVESYAAVPLVNKNKVVGVLAVDNKISKTPIERINIRLLTTMANQAAVVIENARLYHETQDQLFKLTALNKDLIEMTNYNKDILTNMASGVMVIDSKGNIQTVNRKAEILTGKTSTELTGKNVKNIWPNEKEFIKKLTRYNQDKDVAKEVKFNGTGENSVLAISTTPLKDAQNHVKGKLAVISDITEISKLELQVRRSDKLSALGRMAAGVAHEINNPLTSMRLFVQMMADRYNTDPNFWASHNDILLNELDRLDKIVGDFVGFAKTPELRIEDVKLKAIVEKVLRLINVQAQEQKVLIETSVEDDLHIRGDAQRLTQVLMNLILNAIQAMPPNSKDRRISLSGHNIDNQVAEIKITDSGCGISKENMEKLFTPFFTTKEKGTGLGLSIIHKLIEEHGGTIDVSSTVGVGSTFTITIPIPGAKVYAPIEVSEATQTQPAMEVS